MGAAHTHGKFLTVRIAPNLEVTPAGRMHKSRGVECGGDFEGDVGIPRILS